MGTFQPVVVTFFHTSPTFLVEHYLPGILYPCFTDQKSKIAWLQALSVEPSSLLSETLKKEENILPPVELSSEPPLYRLPT